ncbi:Vignain [Glycine soja]
MKTITTLTYTIFNLLIFCNAWISASECPPMHWYNSSNLEAMRSAKTLKNSYNLTDNKFADLTNEEFVSPYLGFGTRFLPHTGFMYHEHEDLPESKDWRKEGAVSDIKDQGNCGSCWAFSAVAAVEGINKIKSGKLVSLSEQEFRDCDVEDGNQGCEGVDGTCNKEKALHHAANISGHVKVPANDEAMLKAKAAAANQRQLNHGVTIVGYGKGTSDKYWIVKNSWGADWGESGYIRMKRDAFDKAGTCGIAMQASYPLKD